MEAIVLDCLSFRINTPTAHTFLSMFKQALALQPRACALASYLTVGGRACVHSSLGSRTT